MFDDENQPRVPKGGVVHRIGEPLDTMSLKELAERIAALQGEIARLEAVVAAKQASKQAADSFFKS